MLIIPFSQFFKPTKYPVSHFITKRFYKLTPSAIKNASSPQIALELYSQMHRNSTPVDSFSILYTLKSCARLKNLTLIRHLHSHIIKLGFHTNVYVATSLLHSYVLASLSDACNLFDEMPERNTVTWNTMISGYSRSGNVDKACACFEEMPLKDVGSWSAMITAYINHGFWDKGLLLFREMMAKSEVKPDQVTAGTVLSGCTLMGFHGLLVGKSVHGFIVKNGWELNAEIGTVLVDMYAKCGYLKNAVQVFDLMKERNVMTWTAVICGAAQHGFSQEALTLFKMMEETKVRPNELTFTGILNACAHSGLVEEGRVYFRLIKEYGLEHRVQHYGCLVDLFGKAGLLDEAYEVIKTMKCETNVVIWGSFLSACKEHKRFDMAERVIEQVLTVTKPDNDGGIYTLICDLYTSNERWDDAEKVRKLMLNQHVRKARGSSFI
ncbi:pentatricopeptide repeat-containing protein At5g66520-like [Mercurialis annua]|uniref:pentatricopeptide repeat-containing protein At5g66520-like n=1 Tax=Mercurialis annua TaxID=3986 RepID=UPI002160070C|nr:pentatricopeptide repeat-containing protein At5g66520-like [Mercurialis annua]